MTTILLAASFGCAVVNVALLWWISRLRAEVKADIAEVRLCNQEYAEAMVLFRYGALDEAMEMAQRWKGRVR